MTNQTCTNFEEAPASWNTRYVTQDGFECQLTLRSESGTELMTKAHSAITWLLKNGCRPAFGGYRSREPKEVISSTLPDGSLNPAWCSIHNLIMHKRVGKDGQEWYSHSLPDNKWCKGMKNNNT